VRTTGTLPDLAYHHTASLGASDCAYWRGSLALLDRVVTLHLDEFTTMAEGVLPSVDSKSAPGRTSAGEGRPC